MSLSILVAIAICMITLPFIIFLYDFWQMVAYPWLHKKWWARRIGISVSVPWPTGMVEVGPASIEWNGLINEPRQIVFSADPNDHYRPWLEQHVGKQGRDWQWVYTLMPMDTIIIEFARGHEEWAVQASLMWNN